MNRYILLFLFLSASFGASAQSNETYRITPLDSILRQHVDTILVFYKTGFSLLSHSSIAYITKKDTITNIFKYEKSIKIKHTLPSGLRYFLYLKRFMKDPQERNFDENLIIYDIPQDKARQLWSDIMLLNPLNMQDDLILGSGCLEDKSAYTIGSIIYDHNIYDAGYFNLAMITKDEIKYFKFYAPDHFLKTCKETSGRKTIVDIENLISNYLELSPIK